MKQVKCVLLAAVSALRRFSVDVVLALWQSWKWIWLQLLVWIFGEMCLGVVGIRLYWGHFGILAEVFAECIIVYTIIYCFYARFVPRSLWRKTFIYPYLLYCLLVYLGILWHNDWRVSIVTVDSYMLDGWFAPLYGLGCWLAVRLIKRYVASHGLAVTGKVLHVGWNVLACIIVFICLLIPTVLYFNLREERREVVEVEPTDTVYDDDLFQELPAYLNSVAGHDERDTIVGKFDGVHEDTLFVYVKDCARWVKDSVGVHREYDDDCDQPYRYYAMSNSKRIPPIELFGHPDVQPKLVYEGDLDGNGKDEWGYLHTWLTSQWRTYRVFTLVGKEWRYLSDDWKLLSTPGYFRASGEEVVEPGSRKGTIKINYGTWDEGIEIRDTVIVPTFAVINDDEE